MKAVHFGAGNIGRGFIGPMLIESGYDLTFVDVDEGRINLLNSLGQYPVILVGEDEQTQQISGFRGVSGNNVDAVADAVAEADIITTAVGKVALGHVAPVIAKGFSKKLELSRLATKPFQIVVIACENVSDNTSFLLALIKLHLTEDEWAEVNRLGNFPNCVVDRIVPNIEQEPSAHPLTVVVEEYSQLVLDRASLKDDVVPIQGAELTDNISGVLAQKLFTLNMAHSIIGYYGYLAGFGMVHEAVQDYRISNLLEGAVEEVSKLLIARYGISQEKQKEYSNKMISRFRNPRLPDNLMRITKDPKRKLGPSDRLIAPSKQALEFGITPTFLSTGIAGALAFDYQGDRQALELIAELRQKGIDAVLRDVASLNPDETLTQMIKSDFLFHELSRNKVWAT